MRRAVALEGEREDFEGQGLETAGHEEGRVLLEAASQLALGDDEDEQAKVFDNVCNALEIEETGMVGELLPPSRR